MIVYSIVPEDIVFDGIEDFSPDYMDLELNGISMQIEPMNAKQARIVRLYSTDAQDYLNPQFAPGSVINFNPVFLNKQ